MDAVTAAGMFIAGWLASYALRALKKLALFFMGIQTLFLLMLERQGIININYAEIWRAIEGFLTFNKEIILAYLPYSIPLIAGFAVGLVFPKSIVICSRRRKYIEVRD
ncbi:hypothetical protein DRJ19_00670 [Candidatus Woesearchaeota archaeon]|nr:MAG: hypothetical protein DRJ19_00670 [Candidatus Woesearchaeota archaeon]RLE44362.1 MAG: hypothetical protein DRJ16_02390 [Candidatus Woesearchaeota archaeon]